MKNCYIGLIKKLNFFGLLLFVFVFANTLSAIANPGVTTYQAKIIKPDGLPLESSSVNFKFTILDPAGTCILYSETYSSVNMASTAGLISFSLGSGVKTYPVSATTFAEVFSNITPTLSCDAGGPGTYSPGASDVRKIVMQFHDGTGWQTLPAMNINAVPYAMYATEAQKISGLPSCVPGQALGYNGISFSCESVSGGGVTSSTVIAALGYEPVQPASFTSVNSTVSSVSSTVSSLSNNLNSVSSTVNTLSGNVFSVSSTVSGLTSAVSTLSTTVSNLSASMAALTSSQWIASGTSLSYSGGNVGIGTSNPTSGLTVSGSAYISGSMVMGNTPPSGGVLDMGPIFGTSFPYKAQSVRQDTLTDFLAGGSGVTTGEILSIKLNAPTNNAGTAIGSFHHVQNIPSNTRNYGAIAGNYVLAKNDGSGDLNELYGSTMVTFQNGSGTVTSVHGLAAQSYIYNGSVTNNYGALFSSARYGGTLENNYGVKIDGAFGTVTNNYGLYIADQTTATASVVNYNFYSEGLSAHNYFAGLLGIGELAPTAKLHLGAGSAITAPLKLTSGTLLTAPASGAIEYDGANLYFTDGTNTRRTIATGSGVTSASIAAALGYTPANSSTVATLNTSLNAASSTVAAVSSTVMNLAASVTTISNTVSSLSASMSALTASQWISSGTAISYSNGNVGIGTSNATSRLTVSGSAYLSGPVVTGNTPPTGGAFNMGPLFGSMTYNSPFFRQDSLTDLSAQITAGEVASTKFNADSNNGTIAVGRFSYTQNAPGNSRNHASLVGDYVVADNNGSGTVGEVGGLFTLSVHNGSSTATSMYGVYSRSYAYNGHVGSSYGGYFSSSSQGGSITNNFGIFADASGVAAQSNYGVYIANTGSVVASQTYNLYSAGINSNNHFAGFVGIGVTSPTARLHLPAGTATTAAFKLTSSTLLTTPVSGAIEYDGTNLYYTDGTSTRKTLATGVGVTSSTIASALGYTPANSATVSTLQNTVASMAASQWTASGSTINFSSGNVGIGTSTPTQTLHVSGSIRTNTIYAADGAFNSPSITFANAMGTGLYNASGYLGFSVASGMRAQLTNSSFSFNSGGAGPQIYFTGGSATNPSYAFNVDSDTGMFNPNGSGGSNELGFSTAGVERLRIASAGSVGIGTSAPVTTLHIVSTQPATALHPDRAGLILEAEGTSVGGRMATKVYSDTENPLFVAYRSRGSKANPQPLLSNDLITAISPVGYDGSNWQTGAHVRFHTTENWSGSAIGSAISFRTVTNGTSTTLDRMRIDHNGNVGIGTTAPRQILDVAPTTGNSIIRATSTNGTTALQLYRNTAGSYTGPVLWANGADLNFGYDSSENAGPTLMTLKTSGALGIGTSTPGEELQVSGSIIVGAQSGATDDNDDYVIKSNGQLHLQANQSGSSNTSYVHLVLEAGTAGSSNSAVIMQTRGSERMRVDPNGNVGIGTTTPGRALQVGQTGAWSDSSGILVKGANPGLELTDTQATPQRWLIANGVVSANDGKLGLAYDVNNARHNIVVTNTGNVGIGTMSNTLAGKPNKLNIVSTNAAGYGIGISVPNTTDSNQIIFVNPNGEVGTINTNGTATTFNTASDRRLKGNIRDLEENKIDDIFNRLQPRQWEWKYAEGQPHGEGFIAQELAEVIPDAVTKGDADPNLKPKEEGFKLWKVDYSKLTPYLTAAIKNIRKKIETLFITTEMHTREIASTQEKVQKLETENANLKQENKAIKDYLCSKDPAAPICK